MYINRIKNITTVLRLEARKKYINDRIQDKIIEINAFIFNVKKNLSHNLLSIFVLNQLIKNIILCKALVSLYQLKNPNLHGSLSIKFFITF